MVKRVPADMADLVYSGPVRGYAHKLWSLPEALHFRAQNRCRRSMHSPAVAEKSRFHSVTEGVGGFHRDTTAVMAVPSIVTTMLKGVDIWSATLGGGGGVKETT